MYLRNSLFRKSVRWGLYPFSWGVIFTAIYAMEALYITPQQAAASVVISLVVLYIIIERLAPYEERWSMTFKSFISDMKYLIINGATLMLTSAALGLFAIEIAGNPNGFAADWPLALQLLAILFLFEAINYTVHRTMHEGKGFWGAILWKTHAAHHLPDKLYILMHVAGHPINAIITQTFALVLPIWFMGYDQTAVTIFLMINSMHGLISHFNVDVRIGFLNYIFVGPEIHRYHHSADISQAKNYGATTTIIDQIFGTFVYRPGIAPEQLGVTDTQNLPQYDDVLTVMKLPFKRH